MLQHGGTRTPTNGLQERWWNGQAWAEDVRPLAPTMAAPPPAPVPVAEPLPDVPPESWMISDDGKNGVVTMEAQGLERLVKKLVGRDDRQFIPYSSIQFVEHDRKRVGRNVAVLHVGGKAIEWKVAKDAEGFVNAVNYRIANR